MLAFLFSRLVRIRRRSKFAATLSAMSAIVIACAAPADSPDPRPDSEGTTWVRTRLFGAQCRCHAGLAPEANLDLSSPGLEGRVIGRVSSQCSNQTLVVPGDPDGSYLVRKLTDVVPACGSKMELPATQTENDVQLVRAWVASLDRLTPFR